MPTAEPGYIFLGGTECYPLSISEMGLGWPDQRKETICEEFTIPGSVWLDLTL